MISDKAVGTGKGAKVFGMDYDETMDDDGYGFEYEDESFGTDGSPSEKPDSSVFEELSYKILDHQQVFQEMDILIQRANTILQLPSRMARLLLSHFNWNEERVLEKYYLSQEDGSLPDLLKEAGVAVDQGFFTHMSGLEKVSAMNGIEGMETTCQICCDDVVDGRMVDLGCGHPYCDSCWFHFIKVNIMDEGLSSNMTCMNPDCQVTVDDKTVLDIIRRKQENIDPVEVILTAESEPKGELAAKEDDCQSLIKRYQMLITASFIQCNRKLRSCPNPIGCQYIIRADDTVCQPILCKCSHSFCFKCMEDWHEPVSCEYLKCWNKKAADDSETLNWIISFTKLCPKCETTIEKNGGCNHMTCAKCKAEFCWSCLTLWASHDHSVGCTQYREETDPGRENAKAVAEQSLKRYLFYFDRFQNHKNSLGYEKELRNTVEEKVEMVQISSNMTWAEVQFLVDAVDILCQCRQTLMYTYIFAYFLKEDNNALIFIQNQKDLQDRVEKLSGFLERDLADVTVESMPNIKQEVMDRSVYCKNRRDALLQHIKEGYDHNEWTYIDTSYL